MNMPPILDRLFYKMRCTWAKWRSEQREKNMAHTIIGYYATHPTNDAEIQEALRYLEKYPLTILPGEYTHKYKPSDIEVLCDEARGLHYVMHEGKRLYFRRGSTVENIRLCYNGLLKEQDPLSPHCYRGEDFVPEAGDVLFDIGSAEGIFSLTHIETVKHVCLFEMDKEWIEALEATFAPWADKVTLINRCVSSSDTDYMVSIDRFVQNEQRFPGFVKIDVEGAEEAVLAGMKETLRDPRKIKIALCTYHQAGDFEKYSHRFKADGYRLSASDGVMLFLNGWRNIAPPYFRKGVLRILKEEGQA